MKFINEWGANAKQTDKYNFPSQQGHIEVPISSLNKILGN